MACSLPVVATAVGGNTELVNEDNGICVPPDDVDALAAGLLRLIEDKELRKKMGNTSLKKIKDNFSWDKAMAELESYYRSLVKV
jgi:glycosyltransferase involved in cell wall biosynthesis